MWSCSSLKKIKLKPYYNKNENIELKKIKLKKSVFKNWQEKFSKNWKPEKSFLGGKIVLKSWKLEVFLPEITVELWRYWAELQSLIHPCVFPFRPREISVFFERLTFSWNLILISNLPFFLGYLKLFSFHVFHLNFVANFESWQLSNAVIKNWNFRVGFVIFFFEKIRAEV